MEFSSGFGILIIFPKRKLKFIVKIFSNFSQNIRSENQNPKEIIKTWIIMDKIKEDIKDIYAKL